MKNETTEQTISVLVPKGASNIRVDILETEGKVNITFNNATIEEEQKVETKSNFATEEWIEEYFPVAKLSTLSLDDEFLKYEPETDNQKKFKERLVKAIKSGLSDIRVQRIDPSFDDDGNICFCRGKKPAVGKSANWWKKKAEEFLPEHGSRMGLTKEKIGCLGLLIKYLVEENGYTLSNAWKAVCDQSKDLGHYWDSKNAKYDFEPTGSRQVGDWCDLGNICKITKDEEASGFSLVGGCYNFYGDFCPLTVVGSIYNPINDYNNSVGWLVLSE